MDERYLKKLEDKDWYGFRDQLGHPLCNCKQWKELKKEIEIFKKAKYINCLFLLKSEMPHN